MGWRDWREWNERRDLEPHAVRARLTRQGQEKRTARRVCTAKGVADGSDFGVRRMSRQQTTIEAATAPRNACAQATGATSAGAFCQLRASALRPPKADGVTGAGFALALGFGSITDKSNAGKCLKEAPDPKIT